MTPTQFDLPLRVSKLRRDWIDENYDTACVIARNLGQFTTDDLHTALCTTPPHPNYWGGLTARMVIDNIIVEIGRVKSIRPQANGRKISLWGAVI